MMNKNLEEMNINSVISELVTYAIEKKLIPACERIYSTNLLLDVLQLDSYTAPADSPADSVTGPVESTADHNTLEFLADAAGSKQRPLSEILTDLCDYACSRNIFEDSVTLRDLFDTKIMNCVMPRPSTVQAHFKEEYQKSPEAATAFYYDFSQNSNYIRRDRIAKDMKWLAPSDYGDIEITINLSKPEKDPKAIAAAKLSKNVSYPECMLCMENEGYAGRLNHPARQTHRIIPITIAGSEWGLQYSPYVYYNEHCIVFNGKHVPMQICRATFEKLFDFIKLFPHYFLGSNADLPIVGGSILSHDHFQGGHHTFAMAKASDIYSFTVPGFEDVKCSVIKWPMSVIRIQSSDSSKLIDLASHILDKWRGYTDESAFVFAETNGEPHNTITPIARFVDGEFQLDLTLRNNITTEKHPLGVYHPHEKLHHIKKENIGLIEVMGLAVLPSRLKHEMAVLADYIVNKKDITSCDEIAKHAEWAAEFLPSYSCITKENIEEILQCEIGKVFVQVLEDAGVYKCNEDGLESFKRFIETL